MTEPLTVEKFYFIHMANGKKYLVGAYNKEEAVEQVVSICGDYNFIEAPIPPQYQ